MTSQTKAAILERHAANDLLNMAAPSLTRRHDTDLSVDEMVAPLDERIIDRAGGALDDGQTHYVSVPGIDPLREATAAYINGACGTAFEKDNVLVTAGVQESRFLTIQLIEQGRIAVPMTVHPGVKRALGVRPKTYDWMAVDPDRALPTPEAIRKALADGCGLLYLESPSRLTGAAYTADEVQAIADAVKQHDAAVIWDQGLMPYAVDGAPSLAGVEGMQPHTAVIGEAFPGMGLASWFIGYIAAPTDWIPPMQKQKQVMAICTSTASQYAALEAADIFETTHASQLEKMTQMRAHLVELAGQLGLTALEGDAVNVLALRMTEGNKGAALKTWAEAGYTIADGADFGTPNVVRLAVTPDETAVHALKLLAEQKG